MASLIKTTVETDFKVTGKPEKAIAKTSKLTKAQAKQSKTVTKLSKRIGVLSFAYKKLSSAIPSLKTLALAGAGIAIGILVLAKRQIELADTIGKTADALGVGIEFLQEFRFAGEQAGVSIQATDKALGKLTKSLGEAKVGTGALTTFLKLYDSSLLETLKNTKTTEQGLDILFTRLASMQDITKRAALANAAFGRSGAAVNIMIKDGIKSYRDARQEAQKLGIVLGSELVRGAELAADAINRMRRMFSANLTKVMVSLAPSIVSIGNAAVDAAPKIAAFINSFIPSELASSGELENRLSGLLAQEMQYEMLLEKMGGKGYFAKGTSDSLNRVREEISSIQSLIALAKNAEKTLVESSLLEEQEGKREAFRKNITKHEEKADQLGETRIQRLRREQGALIEEARALGFTQTELTKLAESLGIATNKQIDFIKATEKAKEPLASFISGAKDTNAALQNTAVEGLRSMEDGLLDLMEGTKNAKEAFRDMATSILRDIARMVIRKTITAPLAGSISDFMTSKASGGIIHRASGGSVPQFASGGRRDSVPAMLEAGEFVVRKPIAQKVGLPSLQRLNSTGQMNQQPIIHIHNEGTPQEESQAPQVSFNFEQMVLDIWTKDFNSNGITRQSLRGNTIR